MKNWFRSCEINRADKQDLVYSGPQSVFFPSPYWIYFLETATSHIFLNHIKFSTKTHMKIWWPDEYKNLIKRWGGKMQKTTQEGDGYRCSVVCQTKTAVGSQNMINIKLESIYINSYFICHSHEIWKACHRTTVLSIMWS